MAMKPMMTLKVGTKKAMRQRLKVSAYSVSAQVQKV